MQGFEVARAFHAEVVEPILRRGRPGLAYAAARLGSGSDVLGLDDAQSQDHDWGCRLTLLVDGNDAALVPEIRALLDAELPDSFAGLPVRFPVTWDPSGSHQVGVSTVGDFAASRLGVDPRTPWESVDWLVLTGQSVLEVAGGAVFTDATTGLSRVREQLRWYPSEVADYVLAAAWTRLGQRLPMVGRTAERRQETQSRLLCADLVSDLIRLAFLVERAWAPYAKWRGALFARLAPADALAGPLETALTAPAWRDRESAIAKAADLLLARQRALRAAGERAVAGLPATATAPFFDRPYRTIDSRIAETLLAGVTDPVLLALPPGLGCVDQWVDSDGVLSRPENRAGLLAAYRAWT